MNPKVGEIIHAVPTKSNQYLEYEYRKHELMKLVGWFADPGTPEELCDNTVYELVINEIAKRVFTSVINQSITKRRRRGITAEMYRVRSRRGYLCNFLYYVTEILMYIFSKHD